MAEEQEIIPLAMAKEQELIPLVSDVTAHCAGCTCSCVATTTLRRDTEPSVGTSLTTGSEHSGGNNGAGSGNGHVEEDLSEHVGDDDDYDDKSCAADVEATNLQELNSGSHEKLRIAFQGWEKSIEQYKERSLIWEAKQNAFRNEIYQVIGFCIVFQGVIYTAVAQSSMLRCHNWWSSLSLSLLVTLVTIFVVLQKIVSLSKLGTTMASEKFLAQVLQTRINNVIINVGPRLFDFREHASGARSRRKFVVSRGAMLYSFAVVGVLLCFSGILTHSHWSILCEPGIEIP